MTRTRRRGQPLLALLLLVVVWTGVRALLWESPFVSGPTLAARAQQVVVQRGLGRTGRLADVTSPSALPAEIRFAQTGFAPATHSVAPRGNPDFFATPSSRLSLAQATRPQLVPTPTADEGGPFQSTTIAQARIPAAISGYEPDKASRRAEQGSGRRWSADGWFLWRGGGTQFNAPGAGLPGANVPGGTYGASQYGAVLRYRLAPFNPLQPTLYLRGTGSIDEPRYQEAAAGFSLRPLAHVPVAAVAELRATHSFGETRLRPAVALVSGLALPRLPLAVTGEAYVQMGYVAGRGATAFVDGQFRLERQLAQIGPSRVRVGAGAWGGAQEGAQRLDVGPSASIGFAVGGAAARLSADWRFRVAGRAAPQSGPAVTLSAGF